MKREERKSGLRLKLKKVNVSYKSDTKNVSDDKESYPRKRKVEEKDYPLRSKFKETEANCKYYETNIELQKNGNKVYIEKNKDSKKA